MGTELMRYKSHSGVRGGIARGVRKGYPKTSGRQQLRRLVPATLSFHNWPQSATQSLLRGVQKGRLLGVTSLQVVKGARI